MSFVNTLHQIYFKSTGHSFTNMGRMFLRLFVGIMIVQFGVRQLMGEDGANLPEFIPYLEYGLAHWLVIVVEIICPFFIMIGLFTRAMILPPFVLLIVSACKIGIASGPFAAAVISQLCVPFLFMGILMFLFLVGAGKISVDYFYSLYLISRDHNGKEEDLEEV